MLASCLMVDRLDKVVSIPVVSGVISHLLSLGVACGLIFKLDISTYSQLVSVRRNKETFIYSLHKP